MTERDIFMVNDKYRVCAKCKDTKPVSEFNKRRLSQGKIGYQGYCKPCSKKAVFDYLSKNKSASIW